MKFIIDVEEFWLEPDEAEESLSEELKKQVVHDVVSKIKDSIMSLTKEQFEINSKKAIVDELVPTVNRVIADFLVTGTVPGKYKNDPPITYMDFIKQEVQNSTPWRNLHDVVEKMVREKSQAISIELKERYDTAFATQIVMKLGSQGMLKDDVAKLLLPTEQK